MLRCSHTECIWYISRFSWIIFGVQTYVAWVLLKICTIYGIRDGAWQAFSKSVPDLQSFLSAVLVEKTQSVLILRDSLHSFRMMATTFSVPMPPFTCFCTKKAQIWIQLLTELMKYFRKQH